MRFTATHKEICENPSNLRAPMPCTCQKLEAYRVKKCCIPKKYYLYSV
jgi:hypothetical protein